MPDGVLIVPGEVVSAGLPIGLSGNTGFSSRPHLHFVVGEAPDKSDPVYFKGYEKEKLKKGKTYFNDFE